MAIEINVCGMCYTREGEEGTLTRADGGLIEATLEGKAVDFYACRVCRLGVYQAFHKMLLASGVPEEETGYLDAVRELESLEEEGGDVDHLDDTGDVDDVTQDDDDSEHDGDDLDDVVDDDDDVDDDVDDVAEAVVSEVAENRPAPAPVSEKVVRDATVIRNLTTAQKREIRAWGRSRGMKVGDRGPIPKDVIDKYFAEK